MPDIEGFVAAVLKANKAAYITLRKPPTISRSSTLPLLLPLGSLARAVHPQRG